MRRTVSLLLAVPVAAIFVVFLSEVSGSESSRSAGATETGAEAQIPSTFTNLEILPADISRGDLVGVMRKFAGDLGVRCDHCHVGENPDTLENFDFASEEKETKQVARAMMRMVSEINGTLIPASGRDPAGLIEVGCVTCHHGITRPQTLMQVLAEALEEGGGDAAVARYRELRDEYYGRAVYDFGRGKLSGFAESVSRDQRDFDSATKLLELNIEFYPDWGYNYYMLGQVKATAGDREAAIAHLEKAIELEPDNSWYKDALARIQRD